MKKEFKSKAIAIIVNPNAGNGNKQGFEDLCKEVLGDKINYTILEWAKNTSLQDLYHENHLSNYSTIVAVGGDGTVNGIVNAMDLSTQTLAIVPLGSGNGLARSLKLPLNAKEALKLIVEGNQQSIDVIKINDRYSVNVSGAGFDAYMVAIFNQGNKRGFLGYSVAFIKAMRAYKAQSYQIMVNGTKVSRTAYMISFANSPQFGNNTYISPKAQLNNGKLDMVIIKPFPWYQAVVLLWKSMRGKIDNSKYVEIHSDSSFELKSEQNIPFHIDGECVKSEKGFIFEVLSGQLKVIVPRV